MKTIGSRRLLWCIALLLIATSAYILFRKDIWFVKFFLGTSGGFCLLIPNKENPLLYFIVYCLPDGLWYASLLLLMKAFNAKDTFSKVVYILSLSIPFILEALQGLSAIPGTFDVWDIATYLSILTIIEMKNLKKLFQCLALVAFVAMALACTSSQEGIQRNESYEKSLGIVTDESIDSLATTPEFDYAYAE